MKHRSTQNHTKTQHRQAPHAKINIHTHTMNTHTHSHIDDARHTYTHTYPHTGHRSAEVRHAYARPGRQPAIDVGVSARARSYYVPAPLRRDSRGQGGRMNIQEGEESRGRLAGEYIHVLNGVAFADAEKLMADADRCGRLERLSHLYWHQRRERDGTFEDGGGFVGYQQDKSDAERKLDAIPDVQNNTEEEIIRWIWCQIASEGNKFVEKTKIVRYFATHPEIREAFYFHQSEYPRVIFSMVTSKHDCLNFEEFDVTFR